MLGSVLEQFLLPVMRLVFISHYHNLLTTTVSRNYTEYVTGHSRKRLHVPSKLISFGYLQSACNTGWKTDGTTQQ